jgi:hypothetical protein
MPSRFSGEKDEKSSSRKDKKLASKVILDQRRLIMAVNEGKNLWRFAEIDSKRYSHDQKRRNQNLQRECKSRVPL